MCLFPRYILNKRYLSYTTKHGKGHAGMKCDDLRKKYVPIGCGNCYECRRQKAQQWRVRLTEEMKAHKHAYFVTLTFSNESLTSIAEVINPRGGDSRALEKRRLKQNLIDDIRVNDIAKCAIRRFLERYRKKYGKSLCHWFITELGHENTERIHIHGIVFTETPLTNEELHHFWQYGRTDTGQYCNQRTINYIVKYVTKIDTEHKTYQPIICCSAGLGENFVHTEGAQNTYRYKKGETPEYYTLPNGMKVALPIYYRNKLFTDDERQQLWTDRLDKGEIFVNGIRIRNIDSEKSQSYYYRLLEQQQKWNNAIGYGNTSTEWQKESYNLTFQMLQKAKRE